jgi:hypothetical protein
MNGMLRDLLNERADAAGTPDLDLGDLIAQGQQRVRRRRRMVLGGTAAAVVLTVGASVALLQAGERTTSPDVPPATNSPSPSNVDVPDDATDGSQPLTYGLGGTIHYGDRVIEAADDADGLFLVDDGLAIFIDDDGSSNESRLFLTDGGSDPVEIARGVGMVTNGETGSLLVWLDGDDVVVYDTHTRNVLDRLPLNGRGLTNPITVLENAAYWHEYVADTATTEGRDHLVRYDVSTGARTRASQADFQAETRTAPPIIVTGSADSTRPAGDFTVVDSQLVVDTGSEEPGPAFVAATGERLRMSVPAGHEGQSLGVFQWLDDDRFALVAEDGVKNTPTGDLLLCRISTAQCRTIASGEQYWLLPGPNGGIGSED